MRPFTAKQGEVSRTDFAWLDGPKVGDVLGYAWSLTFVRGVDEAEALRRLGAHDDGIRPLTKNECPLPEAVRAWRSGEWTVVIEASDVRLPEMVEALAANTEAIVIFSNVNAWSGFSYLVDGEMMTAFDPLTPDWREGNDPDRFVEAMRDAGFDPDGDPDEDIDPDRPGGSLFLLAARLTGVVLTSEIFNGPLPGALVK
jgi:hypothetical protein